MNGQANNGHKSRYAVIRSRQRIAVLLAFLAVALLAVGAKWPIPIFSLSRHWTARLQVLVILVFVNFTAWNWRCPSCRKYLGHDLGRKICAKCGAQLR